jgi:Nucleolin binding domain
MSEKKGNLSSLESEIVPRIQRYIQDNCYKRYVDINEMAEDLQRRYPEYKRKKKIPFRICVERGMTT